MISCIHCKTKHPNPPEARGSGWTVYYHNNEWRWVCPACQKELDRQEILYKISGNEEEQQEAWGKIIEQFDEAAQDQGDGVLFAGQFYKDGDIQRVPITITVGAYKATDELVERDIEKLQIQAGHYSGGNIAQFILDVFNKFVDRYEEPLDRANIS